MRIIKLSKMTTLYIVYVEEFLNSILLFDKLKTEISDLQYLILLEEHL
jgi:hypothetical protein